MKTIDKYTIYCTAEQTKKALELGAPIKSFENITTASANEGYYLDGTTLVKLPTAEQMCGWLRRKGFQIRAEEYDDYCVGRVFYHYKLICAAGGYGTYEEATLAAIDVALNYLIKKEE